MGKGFGGEKRGPMIRIIVKDDDAGMAANIGGTVLSYVKSFEVELPELEKFLREYWDASPSAKSYWHRQVIGIELVKNHDGTGESSS